MRVSPASEAVPCPDRRVGTFRVLVLAVVVLALLVPGVLASTAAASPQRIVIGYGPAAATARAASAGAPSSGAGNASAEAPEEHTRVVDVAPGTSVSGALSRARRQPGVEWAVPDYVAHAAAGPGTEFIPDDPGTGTEAGGWKALQWNFWGPFGVEAPEAWENLIKDHRPGGKGTIVAVLDTGVAYTNWGHFRRSPDFGQFQFVKGYDFINRGTPPVDRNGHGTFVASTIAEDTDNGYGLTGLAYGAKIMPVRVLDTQGEGEASTIAEGIDFAVKHHAQVINLSLEFAPGVTAKDIPELISAILYAHRKGVLVVAAAGNEARRAIAYPARAPYVVSVGATTEHGCLAAYSNDGTGLTIVAPGGGPDANLPGDPNCHPDEASGRDIFQVTLTGGSPSKFGIPLGYEGTSMATPHVAATAALVIASGVLGPHPTPAQLVARLTATARKLGGGGDESLYGAGLVDAAAATAPGGPDAVTGG
jgi:serine protease